MKTLTIKMANGFIEAKIIEGEKGIFLGRLEINPEEHSDYMRSEQIEGFLMSVVLPQLNGFSREIETEAIEAMAEQEA